MRIDPHIATKSPIGATLFASIILGLGLTGAGAVLGWPWVFIAGVLLLTIGGAAAEPVTALQQILVGAQLPLVARTWFVELLLLVLIATCQPEHPLRWACAAALLPLIRTLTLLIRVPAQRRLDLVGTSLNLDTRADGEPSAWFPTSAQSMNASAALCGLIAVGVALPSVWPLLLAVLLALLAAVWVLGGALRALAHARRSREVGGLPWMQQAVLALAPEVVMYFAGPRESTYQLNMWLPVLEALDRRVLVLIREKHHWEALAPTSLPVVGIPRATDVMDFQIPSARVALYAAHVGNNIHFQRMPRIKHVFIGHGESDKVASVNPVTKGFDEVWVAGRASRDRWEAARVGIRPEAIVEVGRPQLGGIEPPSEADRPIRTVLYAPTWEGWSADLAVSSVPGMGVALMRWLADQSDIRVIYKPHPLTGTVSPVAQRAHEQIVDLLHAHPRGGHVQISERKDLSAHPATHVVVTDGASLFDCFNESDALVGDISSVVPDYLASGKPYAIPNPGNAEHASIRAELASTRAAYFLDLDGGGWPQFLDAVRGTDPLSEARAELRDYILGPRVADPIEPWRAAVSRLIARAEEDWPELRS